MKKVKYLDRHKYDDLGEELGYIKKERKFLKAFGLKVGDCIEIEMRNMNEEVRTCKVEADFAGHYLKYGDGFCETLPIHFLIYNDWRKV